MKPRNIETFNDIAKAKAELRLSMACARHKLGQSIDALQKDLPSIIAKKALLPAGLAFLTYKGAKQVPDWIKAAREDSSTPTPPTQSMNATARFKEEHPLLHYIGSLFFNKTQANEEQSNAS